MNILVVGNVLEDVYLNLDSRTENFELDKHGTKWLDLSFNASEHHFFSRSGSLGGAAVSLEVLKKFGLDASVSDSPLDLSEDSFNNATSSHRYILISDGQVSYFTPSEYSVTNFTPPAQPIDYLYIDRSAKINSNTAAKIHAYLNMSPQTKLILYIYGFNNPHLNSLAPRADLLFIEKNRSESGFQDAPELANITSDKTFFLSETKLSYLNIIEQISPNRIDMFTHLSLFSIAAATILGGILSELSIEDSLKLARINVENSKLNSTLSINELNEIAANPTTNNNLELIAASLVLKGKGILAADESGGSIRKKFAKLNIEDTYENRRDYRNIFFTTPNLEKYINGIILFDETARQLADNGQNFTDFITARCITPGIKVDQGLANFENSVETYTKGLDGLDQRLKEYYLMGLRFAKWRAAFNIYLGKSNEILTPTAKAIDENCQILAEYAKKCQSAGLVPIVEPEVVYDGYYSIEQNAEVTGHILDILFDKLRDFEVNLSACILKVNMVIAGKNFETPSTPEEVGLATAHTLKEHVPTNLAGVVFLSGGQTAEQATMNLAAIEKNGPFPWPVTFSFARALQDPALYAWAGDNANADTARQAFLERLIANTKALKELPS